MMIVFRLALANHRLEWHEDEPLQPLPDTGQPLVVAVASGGSMTSRWSGIHRRTGRRLFIVVAVALQAQQVMLFVYDMSGQDERDDPGRRRR